MEDKELLPFVKRGIPLRMVIPGNLRMRFNSDIACLFFSSSVVSKGSSFAEALALDLQAVSAKIVPKSKTASICFIVAVV